MEGEIWAQIPEYEDYYEFSTLGRIRSWYYYSSSYRGMAKRDIPKIISPGLTLGYQVVNIRIMNKGIVHRDYVHRLICRCFDSSYSKDLVINHINGIKNDNRLCNLECITRKQNTQHAIKSGLLVFGTCEKHSRTGLKNSDAIDIFNSTLSTKELAIKYKISVAAINGIKTGKTWGKVTGKKYTPRYRKYLSVDAILGILKEPGSTYKIAKKYNVDAKTISSIKTGKHYSGITGIKFGSK